MYVAALIWKKLRRSKKKSLFTLLPTPHCSIYNYHSQHRYSKFLSNLCAWPNCFRARKGLPRQKKAMTQLIEICEINSAEIFPKDANTIAIFFSSIIISEISLYLLRSVYCSLWNFVISHAQSCTTQTLIQGFRSGLCLTLQCLRYSLIEIASSLNDMDHAE